ncbi:YaaA family protein [Candidatus Peregrinibacteria bacterium]|nr:YaaA family protein [Candidatus Peregrinibacteria bacterium]
MIILLHSSKTMTIVPAGKETPHSPALLEKTKKLANYLKSLSTNQLAKAMKLSPVLAQKTHTLYQDWTDKPVSLALDSFIGDIYSGLQAPTFTSQDRQYAHQHLRILSGLYGIIRPLDGIYPYRLEMGYKLPDPPFNNLYEYWDDSIAATLPQSEPIINLSSEEFSDVITKFVDKSRIIAPRFLTINPKTGEPSFVVVHAKIARGAFAHWIIKNRIEKIAELKNFNELGYHYDQQLSTSDIPTFICKEFGGKGLSMKKLQKPK